jgi:topoisomerase-4 subunit A
MITNSQVSEKIEESNFKEELSRRYVSYALSTIMSRSLPDVRDGLKPVHRRLLYAMQQLKLDPASGYKKCARVVGDVMGKYHPHGDTAIYDTLVRLAQDFSVRYPLINGQGNFGSIDGDNAAAMRYTESKLTDIAMVLLENIDQDTVEFKPTYDFQDHEPIVLPAAFPNLLANGSEGIAVGMATSIPPHNLDELCRATKLLLDNKDTSIEDLTAIIKGPDFPTGGIIIDNVADISNFYKVGKGSFRLRASWEREDLKSGLYQIIITEIPYQTVKSKIVEKIDDLIDNKKLPLVAAIRDESSDQIRIVIEPRARSVDPEMLMESLFKQSDLESRFNMNINVVNKDLVPGTMNLKEILLAFIDHRDEVIRNHSSFRFNKIVARLEVLGGLLVAYLNIDKVIEIIRYEDEPKQSLIDNFALSDVQAEAILNMRLRSLRKLEEIEIKKESEALNKEKIKLEELLASQNKRFKQIKHELDDIIKKFGEETDIGRRRTKFELAKEIKTIAIEAFVSKDPVTIICSKFGWVRSIKGHVTDGMAVKYKEGDQERFVIKCFTTNNILVFTKNGKFYTIAASQISRSKSDGEPLGMIVDLDENDEPIAMFEYQDNQKLLLVSNKGKAFVTNSSWVLAQTRSGKMILNLPDNSYAKFCYLLPNTHDHIAVIGTNRKFLIFALNEVPEMKRGQGVTLQKYKNGEISDLITFNMTDGLSFKYGDGQRQVSSLKLWIGKRGGVGKLPPVGFPRSNKFS